MLPYTMCECFFFVFFFYSSACETTYDECTKNLWFSKQINKKQKKNSKTRVPALLRLQQFLHRSACVFKYEKVRLSRLYRRHRSPELRTNSTAVYTAEWERYSVCHWRIEWQRDGSGEQRKIWIYVKRGVCVYVSVVPTRFTRPT